MYEMMSEVTKYVTPEIYNPIIIYLSWTTMHYFSAHLYSTYCTNWSVYGFITSPFLTVTPVCKGLGWFMYESSNTISNIFVLASTSLTLYLTKFKFNAEKKD
tara:strand:- start:138 stop:443 length:306 start_codon:yes stop_codon:yes gene_type:complete